MPKRKLDPLPSAAFHILLSLAGEDLHGYAILKEVDMRTNGKVRLSTGTLYGIIKRLLADGLVVERGTADDIFLRPQDPYTQRLLTALPRLEQAS